jgi:hypothetical protein
LEKGRSGNKALCSGWANRLLTLTPMNNHRVGLRWCRYWRRLVVLTIWSTVLGHAEIINIPTDQIFPPGIVFDQVLVSILTPGVTFDPAAPITVSDLGGAAWSSIVVDGYAVASGPEIADSASLQLDVNFSAQENCTAVVRLFLNGKVVRYIELSYDGSTWEVVPLAASGTSLSAPGGIVTGNQASAVATPEPSTLLTLGFGALLVIVGGLKRR